MPLFEYRCQDCGKQFTFLAGVVAGNAAPTCPACQSSSLKKLMSRFSRGRSDDARMEAMAEKLENADFEDEGAARRFAREMGREMAAESGEDVSDEIEQLIEMEARGEGEGDSEGPGGSGSLGAGMGGLAGAGGFGGAPDNTIY